MQKVEKECGAMYTQDNKRPMLNPVLAAHAKAVAAEDVDTLAPSGNAATSEISISEKAYEAIVRNYVLKIPGVLRFTSSSLSGGIAEMIGRKTSDSSVIVVRNGNATVSISATVVLAFEVNIPATAREIEAVIRAKVEEYTGVRVQNVRIVIQDLAEAAVAGGESDDSILPSI
jgi:uncharacterized alkaline shock family protein YloU